MTAVFLFQRAVSRFKLIIFSKFFDRFLFRSAEMIFGVVEVRFYKPVIKFKLFRAANGENVNPDYSEQYRELH